MGVEHSHGSQKLCYINAMQEEECFRNDYETHNVFEMGFDLVQRDRGTPVHHEERQHDFTADPHLTHVPHPHPQSRYQSHQVHEHRP